jgi:threonine synthase
VADRAHTAAFGINVANSLGDFLILSALYDSKGTAVAVDDKEIFEEQVSCAAADGVLMCPEGAATLAAVRRLRADGWLDGDEEVLVLNTGSALKYADTLPVADPPALERDAALPPEATAATRRAAAASAIGPDGSPR